MATQFSHRHLLDIERLSVDDINTILELAERYAAQNRSANKKTNRLAGKTAVNLFFEPSTRTRTSFEIAAKRLGADVVNIISEFSSTKKGETLLDTVLTLNAMQIDALVIRHEEEGVPQFIAPHMQCTVINAGDGKHEHPTQALLDAFTMRRHKKKLAGLVVAICGDVQHSRVARSNIHLLNKFGAKVRVIAPPHFMPQDLNKLKVEAFDKMEEGLQGADVVMTIRVQSERLQNGDNPLSPADYHRRYGLDHGKLAVAKQDVIVMDPMPMNRGLQITSELADDLKYSVMFEQVEWGVAVRMAVLDLLLSAKP